MRTLVPLVVGVLSLAAFFALKGDPAAPSTKPPASSTPDWDRRVDVHTHVHPFVFDRYLNLLRQYGGSVSVNLSSVPDPRVAEALAQRGADQDGRILSFTGVDWRLLEEPDTFGERAAATLERAVQAGARGLKIQKGLGLGFAWPDGARVAIDDARLDPVFDAAGRLGVPVAIHVGDPVAFWEPVTPENERYEELRLNPGWSLVDRPVPSHAELMAEAERRYARHPRTIFIAVHVAGFPEDLDFVDGLLDRNPNVRVDLAARIPELGRHPPEKGRAFFLKHQDRILFGTDLGLGPRSIMLGAPLAAPVTRADVDRFFHATRRYLETNDRGFAHPTPIQGDWTIDGVGLPPAVLRKIYVDNAARLLRIPAARLTPVAPLKAPSPAP